MIHPIHLRKLIVDPVLKYLDMYSPAASNLMLGTAAQESHLGHFLKQVDHNSNPVGPALGIYQMEPLTHLDLYSNFLLRQDKSGLKEEVDEIIPGINTPDNIPAASWMISNLEYATSMARLQYWRQTEGLPDSADIEGLAQYWKKYYNTNLGKGTVEEFVDNYHRFVSGVE